MKSGCKSPKISKSLNVIKAVFHKLDKLLSTVWLILKPINDLPKLWFILNFGFVPEGIIERIGVSITSLSTHPCTSKYDAVLLLDLTD